MTEIRYVSIDGISYPVVLSDETEALLKAKADGKASVGFWDRNGGGQQDLSGRLIWWKIWRTLTRNFWSR